MQASKENPIYTAFLVDGSTEYEITPAMQSLSFSDQDKQIAMSAALSITNTMANGKWLSSLIQPRQRISIFADDGEKKDEVFRGFVWTKYYKSALSSKDIELKCYDNLVYFQESEDSLYFTAGKTTKDIITTIGKNWGVSINYTYQSITHGKMVLRGALSDIITADILDKVKENTGAKYVMISQKDVINIKTAGSNTTTYKITAKNNAIFTRSEQTMDGMITKVIILGKAGKGERVPVQATVAGNTSQYGTLQKLYDRDENTSLADAKKEANTIIQEKGKPSTKYEVQAGDIPWIRKGDLVYINAGAIADRELLVVGIERSISNSSKTMTLTLTNP